VTAYYEDNKDSYLVEEARTVRHILIEPVLDQDGATSTTSTSAGAAAGGDAGEQPSPTERKRGRGTLPGPVVRSPASAVGVSAGPDYLPVSNLKV